MVVLPAPESPVSQMVMPGGAWEPLEDEVNGWCL